MKQRLVLRRNHHLVGVAITNSILLRLEVNWYAAARRPPHGGVPADVPYELIGSDHVSETLKSGEFRVSAVHRRILLRGVV